MQSKKFKIEVGGREFLVEIGKLAEQANGSVVVKYGDTVVLVTCVIGDKPRQGVNYLPLMVDYEEKLYAAGKIKGSRFIKREGRSTDEAVTTGRLIDRVIRPLFNSKIRNDIQVIITVLSFDRENDPVIPGLIGTSIALSISNIPWNGPIGGVSIGQIDKEWIVNPTNGDREKSLLNLVITGTGDRTNMIEGEANEVPEKTIVEALEFAGKHIRKLIDFQKDIIKEFQPEKLELEISKPDSKFIKEVEKFIGDKLEKALYRSEKVERMEEVNKLKEDLSHFIESKYEGEEEKVQEAFDVFEDKIDEMVHKNILEKDKRPDGRKLDEVREISCEIGLLPRTHGSGLFNRGSTQALSVVTLGPPGAEQLLDQMELEGKKRFMHHYNFPPFSVGEVKPMRGPGRRDIGHGALAERALIPLIPSREEFPYTIRIVSEILSSNGSSSMASVCGSILALLDAGVPIKGNAAGIAMGLMLGADGKYKILTDIQGPEDHHGDMDFKIAGTRKGITSFQMDVKVEGLSLKILEDTLAQAKKTREEILNKMEAVIKTPRSDLSLYAPRVYVIKINPDRIGNVIGPGGKMINKIIDETGATIDIEDDGTIFVASEKADGAKKAITWVKSLTRELKVGEIFQGKVVKVTDFGAFIEVAPGQEGLLHVSELSLEGKDKKIEDLIHRGDTVTVKIKNIDDLGRINLALFKKGIRM
jgi:polyribonucleotide nucleotidyltransferase